MPVLQDAKLEIIAQHIANGATRTDAYCAAYPNSTKAAAAVSASRMLSDPTRGAVVDARVTEILREREQARIDAAKVAAQQTGMTKAWVLEGLRKNFERAMQEEPVIRDGVPTGEFTYQGSVANRALELVGKELGMFIDRRETGQPGEFESMGKDELERYIADRRHLIADREGKDAPSDGATGQPSARGNGVGKPH